MWRERPASTAGLARSGRGRARDRQSHRYACRSVFPPPRELAHAQETIQQNTGLRPRVVRAPYGARWFGLRQAQQRLGLLGVMWTTLALDWKWPQPRVIQRLLEGARNGAIFCLHDGRRLEPSPDIGATLGAVRAVLPKLMEQGFHFEKVTDILCPTQN